MGSTEVKLPPEYVEMLRRKEKEVSIIFGYTHIYKATYTNYRGETAVRTFSFLSTYFGSTQYHEKPQILFRVFDYDRNAERDYAASEITTLELKKD